MTSKNLPKLTGGQLWQSVRQRAAARPQVMRASLVLLVLLATYGWAKLREPGSREVAAGRPEADFQAGRLFSSSVAAVYKEQDARLAKSAHQYADTLKNLEEKLSQVEKRLAVAEVGHPPAPAGSPPAPAGPPQIDTNPSTKAGAQAPGAAGVPVPGGVSSVPGVVPPQNPWAQGQGSQYLGARGLSGPTFRPPAVAPGRGPASISFPVKAEEPLDLGIVLPPGSYVRAKMLTGVAAPEGRPYPVLLQLDFAHILPNRRRLDLSGCFMIVKAQGDLSTERLQMQATKMSCVGTGGRMFEREVSGFVVGDEDNNFAVAGEVVSKQDRVAVMAFLASIVEGVGKAVQQAQTTQQTGPMGGSQTVLTGDQQKYLAAGGASDAGGMVAQWYLKEAQNLLPTINVNSGRDVWVVMQESVNLPKSYFKHAENKGERNDPYSYVTRLLE